jgi:uncharacterized membrane protein (DUF485 family)
MVKDINNDRNKKLEENLIIIQDIARTEVFKKFYHFGFILSAFLFIIPLILIVIGYIPFFNKTWVIPNELYYFILGLQICNMILTIILSYIKHNSIGKNDIDMDMLTKEMDNK